MSLRISTTINATLSLVQSNNPVIITASGGVTATGTMADAIDGDSSTAWMISNAGTVSSASGFGVNFNGPSSNVSNSGSISGAGEVFLNNEGSVRNTAEGTITATGGSGSPLATVSGIYVTGPSSAGMSAISVTNAGTVNAADGYGIALDAVALNDGRSINNTATGSIAGSIAGVSLANQSATVVNNGSISATGSGGAAITISAGGAVTNSTGATLSADAYGVFASGVAASVTNAGQVTSASAIGFEAGGTVTNLCERGSITW